MIGKVYGIFTRFVRRLVLRWRGLRIPHSSNIFLPFTIRGGENIRIGNETRIQKYGWLQALPLTNAGKAELIIGNRCRIAFFCHIVATRRIVIGNNVNIANSVYLSDNLHGFEDPEVPPRDQPLIQKNDVIIGDDTWLGERVVVIGAKVGKHCVVGAHSVVTKDIPDYSVAVGIPAKIIKRYNFATKKWEKTNPDGTFIDD